MVDLSLTTSECRNGCGKKVEHLAAGPVPFCVNCQDALLPKDVSRKSECASDDCSLPVRTTEFCIPCQIKKGIRAHGFTDDSAGMTAKALQRRSATVAGSRSLGRAGVPARYQRFTRKSWEEKYEKSWNDTGIYAWNHKEGAPSKERITLADLCQAFIEQKDPEHQWLIVLFGSHGHRKTGIVTAMLNECLKAGLGGLWRDSEELVCALEYGIDEKNRVDENWKPWRIPYNEAMNAETFVCDDLATIRGKSAGMGKSDKWWQEKFALLLRKRDAEMRRTLLTANVDSLDELGVINHSLPSRMKVRWAFKIGGKDFRWE